MDNGNHTLLGGLNFAWSRIFRVLRLAMTNLPKEVAIDLQGSLPHTLIETIIALNCLAVIIRFEFSFSTERSIAAAAPG